MIDLVVPVAVVDVGAIEAVVAIDVDVDVAAAPVAAAPQRGTGAAADIDTAKVERIAQAIADGSYKVNAEAIADKLIANAQEVLGSVKR